MYFTELESLLIYFLLQYDCDDMQFYVCCHTLLCCFLSQLCFFEFVSTSSLLPKETRCVVC